MLQESWGRSQKALPKGTTRKVLWAEHWKLVSTLTQSQRKPRGATHWSNTEIKLIQASEGAQSWEGSFPPRLGWLTINECHCSCCWLVTSVTLISWSFMNKNYSLYNKAFLGHAVTYLDANPILASLLMSVAPYWDPSWPLLCSNTMALTIPCYNSTAYLISISQVTAHCFVLRSGDQDSLL